MKTAGAADELDFRMGQVGVFTISGARHLPWLSSFPGPGGSSFKFAINLLDDVREDCNAGGEQTSNQQGVYGGLQN